MQDQQIHHDSYAQTMHSIRQAGEIRRLEANLKFMAKPYNIHRIKLKKQAHNDIEQVIPNPEANPKIESSNSTIPARKGSLNSYFVKGRKSAETKIAYQKKPTAQKNKKSKFATSVATNSLFFERERATEENQSPVTNLKRSTTKEIKTLKRKRRKEIKMKRSMTKKQIKAEQRQAKMEIKMRKILQKRMKLTRRKADKQRKRAEKMRRFQNKVETIFKTVFAYLKRLFDIVSLSLGLALIVFGLFTTGVPPIPMVLIGAILTIVGIASLSAKFVRKVQAKRTVEKYRHSYLNSMQANTKRNEVQVII